MTRRGRALFFAAALAAPAALAAQNAPAVPPPATPPGRGDSVPAGAPPAARPDSALPDSLSPDSFSAVLPPLGPPAGPMPRGSRIVFDRAALKMSGALTLGELLHQVPGAFLVRAGWYGLPEVVHYAGQGASSVELYWDGYAMDPMGEDSAGFDVGRIPLGLFSRVEVEVLPTVLRVYLISDTQGVRRARTETSFGTGDEATNSYRIRYLNRWRGGLGAGLGVNWFGTSGAPSTPAAASDLTLWAKGTWAPSTLTGVEYQYFRYSLNRAVLIDPQTSAVILPGRRVWRSDGFLRAYAATRADGMGFRFDALVGSTSYGDSSSAVAQSIAQGAAIAAYRAVRWSAQAAVRVRDDRTPLQVEARLAATPLSWVTFDASAISRSLLGGRSSREASAGVTARPLGPLQLRGSVRLRDAVAVPAVLADSAQRVTDWSVGAGLATRRLDVDLSLDRHGAYAAPVYGTFGGLVPFGTSQGLRTLTVSAAFRPTAYLTFAGWDREPLIATAPGGAGTAAYEPPHHTRVEVTFRSRFLPHFRRGAFDLLVRIAGEAWGDGVMGSDSSGGRRPARRARGGGLAGGVPAARRRALLVARQCPGRTLPDGAGGPDGPGFATLRRTLGVYELGRGGYHTRLSTNGSAMPQSMTGFGAAEGTVAGGRLRLEVRTVNHRHLNVQLKVPSELAELEPELRERLRAHLTRGHVTVSGRWLEEPPQAAAVTVDRARAAAVVAALRAAGKDLGLAGDVDLALLARLPDVLRVAHAEVTPDPGAVLDVLDRAAAACAAAREREGAALVAELRARIATLAELRARIAERAPERVVAERDRLAQAVQELAGSVAVDPARLAQEVAILANRLDITEELVRFGTHLTALGRLLDGGGSIGRETGFVLQELLREANTMGSKADDAAVAQAVIAVKTEMEKLREQVENLE